MDPSKISERTRRQLEKLPAEKARAESAAARMQTPDAARVAADRAALDHEYRETGNIATTRDPHGPGEVQSFIVELRRQREARGLSLADVAALWNR